MSTMTLNGQRVISGSVTIPFYGAWVADVVLFNPDSITNQATLTIGDLELHGTVFRMASFSGSRSARIVGGAGGWRRNIPAKGYSQQSGIMSSLVLNDAARECGETINISNSVNIGTSWARNEGKGEATLKLITRGQWWIDDAGVTQTSTRDSSLIGSTFTAIAWSGGKGHFEIATENYSDWQPGRTFNASNIGIVQTISTVRFEAENTGKVRLIVLSATSESDRAMAEIRNIVKSELASMLYCAEWDYNVAPSTGVPGLSSKLDLTSNDSRMPDLTNVPLAPGLVMSAPMTGAQCRVRFVNADPGKPEIVWLGKATEHIMTTEACALLIYNTLAALMTAAGGGPLLAVVLQPLIGAAVAAALAAPAAPVVGTIAQTAAQVASTASMLTGAPAVATGSLIDAAISAALSAKALDVTGFCPSVGVSYGT